MAHDAGRALAAATEADAGPPPSFEAILRELADERRFPRLHRIAFAAAIGPAPEGFEAGEEFRWGLERIFDGIDALIRISSRP